MSITNLIENNKANFSDTWHKFTSTGIFITNNKDKDKF